MKNKVHNSKVIVTLEMEGNKRNCKWITDNIAYRINHLLDNEFSWHFTGKGKVEIKWGVTVKIL